MTFRPDTFRDLANWILVGIGLVLSALLPRLARTLRRLAKKSARVSVTPPSTIDDSGTVTAHASASAVEAISDGGTVYVKLTPSAVEAIA